jgi:PAS domain S-box-containing protein
MASGTGRDAQERFMMEARLLAHIDNSPLAFVEFDPALNIIGWSGSAERMFGWTAEEMIGRNASAITWIHEDDVPSVKEEAGKLLRGEQVRSMNRNRNYRKDGSIIHCEWYDSALYDEQGRLVSILSQVLDVTAREQAALAVRDSERLYRAIGESIEFGVWVCAPDGRNTYASPSFLRLVGMTQEQCSSFGWGEVLHPDDAEQTIAAWKECVRTGANWYREHRFRGVDGLWHPILARGVPVKDDRGEVICWAGINLDISHLKSAEEALRAADRRKTEFLAILSHELRNPLAPIRSAIYVLKGAGPGTEQAERARAVIERQTDHLCRLVDDLLDVTRIANGKIELRRQRLDLREVAARAAEDARALVESRGVALEVQLPASPIWVEADATRVAQVVGNLVQNASKFSRRGDRIQVSLSAVEGEAELSVRDTGTGIDPLLLPTLFTPFVQGARTIDRSEGGLGLGLALVKGLVELHGGRVSARSAGIGHGSEFIVRLPSLPLASAATASEGPAVAPPLSSPRTILIVDDNRDGADTLAEVVEMLGHVAVVAYDGESALERIEAKPPDLVLCDVGLPGMSGYEVAKAIRARGGRMPLYALTGYALPDDVKVARLAGFDGHLPKPVEIAMVARLLREG